LIKTTDVVVLGAPASTNQRQGLDYASLSAVNPRLLYLNVSAFTSLGPRANDVGFDGIGQVMSGSAFISGFGDQPTRSFASFIDVTTGIYSAFAIACALLDRNKTGKGHNLETSLLTSGYAIMSWILIEQELTKRNRQRSGNRAQSSAPSDMFSTKDGWIVVQTLGDGMFKRAAKLIGRPEWANDPRFQTDNSRADHGEILSAGVAEWCARYTNEEALQLLRANRVPGAPVHSLQEALEEPQLEALGLMQNVPHPGRSDLRLMKAPFMADGEFPPIRQRPPLAGEHTDELLRELGYSADVVAKLRAANIV
jgi:crotonobetainyl-CoA:carnitine CoA-transferase CaiB-like acyl-CoA transferase